MLWLHVWPTLVCGDFSIALCGMKGHQKQKRVKLGQGYSAQVDKTIKPSSYKSTSKNYGPSFHGDPWNYNVHPSKFSFLRVFYTVNFFTTKFMKILPFWNFCTLLLIELSTHGSNPTVRFASMNELEFFWLRGVLTQNSNAVELVKFLEKTQRLHIQIKAATLMMTSCWSFEPWARLFFEEKWNPRLYGQKQTLILATYPSIPFHPYVVLAIWLCIGAPPKIQVENWVITHLEQKFTMDLYGVGIWRAWWGVCKLQCTLLRKCIFVLKFSFFGSNY
jgi:hypothetical protein